MSRILPVGPVIMISVPGAASHRKLEQMPFLAGSSLPGGWGRVEAAAGEQEE
jgi:hypothetical protein